MCAPVVLFVYNRVDHAEKTLKALSLNTKAKETDIFVFSDGAKSKKDEDAVKKVREIIHQENYRTAFKSFTIVESEVNKGLAKSIISGVTKIIEEYKTVIVVEDDCVTTTDFLEYMNDSLSFYKNNEKIWSIGGYTVNLKFPNDYKYQTYVMGRTCSYAWATWLDRWEKVDWEVKDYSSFKKNLKQRKCFNKYGDDRAKMLDMQQIGKTNSWAIRFCYAMFKNDMYTIYPCYSKVKNIGYDIGTHVNVKKDKFYVDLNEQHIASFVDRIEIDERIRKQYVKYFKVNKLKLFLSYIINVMLVRRKK